MDDRQDFLQAVTRQAAQIAEERGQVADAALLYHLSEDFDNVAQVISRALAEAVTVDLEETPPALQPLKPRQDATQEDVQPNSSLSLTVADSPLQLARNMIGLYNANAAYYNKIRPQNRQICITLIDMMEARSLITSSPPRYMEALDKINGLQILPLNAGGNKAAIRTAVQNFGVLPQLLARATGALIVWSVTCIARQREQLIEAKFETAERNQLKQQLANMASDLVDFAGLIRFRLAPRVNEMLARISGEVGVY